jgi:hypothetical protein
MPRVFAVARLITSSNLMDCESVLVRPFLGLGGTLVWRAAIEPLTTLALMAQILFADPAAIEIEAVKTPAGAERLMLVLDRRRQLHSTAKISAAVP